MTLVVAEAVKMEKQNGGNGDNGGKGNGEKNRVKWFGRVRTMVSDCFGDNSATTTIFSLMDYYQGQLRNVNHHNKELMCT